MSDVQDKKQKAVSGQNDKNPIPIGKYTISKILGINTVEVSSEYNSEKVYSDLFEELKNREFDAYKTKYKSTNRNIDLENRFCEILGQDKNKSISAIFKDIKEKVNRMITDNYENEITVNADKLTDCMKKTISNDSLRISWFEKHSRPSNEEGRLALYKISFAFNLSMEDHRKLFTYVFKLKPYLRTPAEFCLTYAKEHNMEYSEAVNLYYKYFSKRIKSGNIPASETKSAENYSGTRTLMDSIKQKSEDEFIKELLNIEKQLKITHQAVKRKIKSIIGTQSIDGFFDKPRSSNYSPWYNNVDDINVESALKTYGSKAVLQLRKIYIICRTYQLWNNFKNEDKKNSFIGFYKTLSNDLIKMNLPQLDYLDDFDRGIILATAYRLHNNTTKSLGDLIDEIVKK